jgi:hypothetical protein
MSQSPNEEQEKPVERCPRGALRLSAAIAPRLPLDQTESRSLAK